MQMFRTQLFGTFCNSQLTLIETESEFPQVCLSEGEKVEAGQLVRWGGGSKGGTHSGLGARGARLKGWLPRQVSLYWA